LEGATVFESLGVGMACSSVYDIFGEDVGKEIYMITMIPIFFIPSIVLNPRMRN
jgi:hypothetical protein